MKTYQDLLETDNLKEFIFKTIRNYQTSDFYQEAYEGNEYARKRNITIMNYKKLLYKMSGEAVADNFSANHKTVSNFFQRFITQENQYLLGNGVQFNDDTTKDKLGGEAFDRAVQKAGKYSLWGAVSYGFFNLDHVDVFSALEFAPLWDEEDGSLKAGIRFWQIDANKPLRATLYELDGYTEYIRKKDGTIEELQPKRTYKQKVVSSAVDGTAIYDYENYPGFPIIPLWGNPDKQSELVGLRSQIDAYDLIKSGFANDLDDVSQIYWILQNAGGMDDIDLAKFLERLRIVRAAVVDQDGATAESHTVEIPYNARESYLTRLENDLYNDAMALNVQALSNGNLTATAINAAYESLNNKTDQFEYCVCDFIQGLLALIGVDDAPTFKRSKIVNQTEETQMILAAAQYLDDETVLKHLPFLNLDEVDGILDRVNAEEAMRFVNEGEGEGELDGQGEEVDG